MKRLKDFDLLGDVEREAIWASLHADKGRVAELGDIVDRWVCESHPWTDSTGDPLDDPGAVRRATDAALDAAGDA